MGSQSDYSTMQYCEQVLKILKVKFETKIVSAHRTPDRMYKFAKSAEKNNISVIVAGAGGSAHLPGMIAALTSTPVLLIQIIRLRKISIIGELNKQNQLKKNLNKCQISHWV